ncbi:MAG: hypothetical protein ACRDNO_32220 [Trebonia sp.]
MNNVRAVYEYDRAAAGIGLFDLAALQHASPCEHGMGPDRVARSPARWHQ